MEIFIRMLLIACCLTFLGCGKKNRTSAAELSADTYLTGKGYFVLSNDAGFLALNVIRGAYPNVSIKPYYSSNGLSWAEQSADWLSFRVGTNIVFGGETVTLSWEGDNQTCVSAMFVQKTAFATATNMDISLLSTRNLKFQNPKRDALERTVEKVIK